MRKLLAVMLLLPGLAAAEGPIKVKAAPLHELAIYPQASAPAEVISLNDSRLEAEITASVVAIPVRVGDRVEAGDELLRLDCRDQESQLAQATAAVEALSARRAFADYQYERARSLIKSQNISEEQLRLRKADAEAMAAEQVSARAGRERAARDVERCRLRAPFQAVVRERLISVGEKAVPGKPLLRLQQLDSLAVSAQVQAFDAESLAEAGAITLQVGGHDYPLSLRRLLPVLDPMSRSREARLEFTAETAPAGSSGRLLWRSERPHLPAEYVLRREGRYGVFVLRDGTARFVAIDAAREGSAVAVALPGETRVVTDGRFNLQDGDPVSVVE